MLSRCLKKLWKPWEPDEIVSVWPNVFKIIQQHRFYNWLPFLSEREEAELIFTYSAYSVLALTLFVWNPLVHEQVPFFPREVTLSIRAEKGQFFFQRKGIKQNLEHGKNNVTNN